jgi:hypothetical protein
MTVSNCSKIYTYSMACLGLEPASCQPLNTVLFCKKYLFFGCLVLEPAVPDLTLKDFMDAFF